MKTMGFNTLWKGTRSVLELITWDRMFIWWRFEVMQENVVREINRTFSIQSSYI